MPCAMCLRCVPAQEVVCAVLLHTAQEVRGTSLQYMVTLQHMAVLLYGPDVYDGCAH
jgi:hypothetical protein